MTWSHRLLAYSALALLGACTGTDDELPTSVTWIELTEESVRSAGLRSLAERLPKARSLLLAEICLGDDAAALLGAQRTHENLGYLAIRDVVVDLEATRQLFLVRGGSPPSSYSRATPSAPRVCSTSSNRAPWSG